MSCKAVMVRCASMRCVAGCRLPAPGHAAGLRCAVVAAGSGGGGGDGSTVARSTVALLLPVFVAASSDDRAGRLLPCCSQRPPALARQACCCLSQRPLRALHCPSIGVAAGAGWPQAKRSGAVGSGSACGSSSSGLLARCPGHLFPCDRMGHLDGSRTCGLPCLLGGASQSHASVSCGRGGRPQAPPVHGRSMPLCTAKAVAPCSEEPIPALVKPCSCRGRPVSDLAAQTAPPAIRLMLRGAVFGALSFFFVLPWAAMAASGSWRAGLSYFLPSMCMVRVFYCGVNCCAHPPSGRRLLGFYTRLTASRPDCGEHRRGGAHLAGGQTAGCLWIDGRQQPVAHGSQPGR